MFKPVNRIPFKCPTSPAHFHCASCNCYRNKTFFFQSFLKRRYRKCTSCHKRSSKSSRSRCTDPIALLRRRLYKHLHAKRYPDFARAMTKETVVSILRANSVCDPRTVKRIVSPNDRVLLSRFESYEVELNWPVLHSVPEIFFRRNI